MTIDSNITDGEVLGADMENEVGAGMVPGRVLGNASFSALVSNNNNASLNGTGNDTWGATTQSPNGSEGTSLEIWRAVIVTIILGAIIIGTIVGNVLVCTAVGIVRKLRTPSNLLIVSLAVSDLLVALLVMPFAAMYEVMGRWILGDGLCDAWTSLDVMLCTASILNLCMISVDRYFVITRPFQYAVKRTPKNIALMITGVWLTSALITLPPLFGWKSEPVPGECMVSQNIGYQFYATIGAFYLPVTVMIVIYYRIYVVSSRIAASEAKSKPGVSGDSRPPSEVHSTLRKPSNEENHNVQVKHEKLSFYQGMGSLPLAC